MHLNCCLVCWIKKQTEAHHSNHCLFSQGPPLSQTNSSDKTFPLAAALLPPPTPPAYHHPILSAPQQTVLREESEACGTDLQTLALPTLRPLMSRCTGEH